MSLTLVIRRPDDSVIELDQGEILIDGLEIIDEVAAAAELRGLSDYADTRDVPEDFEGDLDDLRELLGPPTEWHDATDAAADLEGVAGALGEGEGGVLAEAVRSVARALREFDGPFVLDVV